MKLTSDPTYVTPFGTFEDRYNILNKKSFKELFTIGNLATVFFIVADCITLFMKWYTVSPDSWYFVFLLAIVSAVLLDLPMYIAGKKIREYHDGIIKKKQMLIITLLAVIAFFIAFIPSFILSIATQDATFQEAQSISGAFNSFTDSGDSNPQSVTIAAVFSGILPLGTSIASLVCGLVTYAPLKERLEKLEEVRLYASNQRSQLIWGKAQLSERQKLLVDREEDLFRAHIDAIKSQEQIRIQAYEEALEEALDAEGILHVTENAFSYLDQHQSDSPEDFNPKVLNDLLADPVIEESRGMSKSKTIDAA